MILFDKIHSKNHKCIVFVNKVEHINNIFDLLSSIDPDNQYKVKKAFKKLGAAENEEGIKGMINGKYDILISTDGTLGRGIDIQCL